MNHFHWKLKWCDPFGSCNKKPRWKSQCSIFFLRFGAIRKFVKWLERIDFRFVWGIVGCFPFGLFVCLAKEQKWLFINACYHQSGPFKKKTNEHNRAVCIHLFGLLGGSSFILVDQYFLRVSTMFCLSILLFEIIISSYWLHNSYKHRLIWEHLCSTIV